MKSKLSSLCSYRKGKIAVSELDSTNYISTENMLSDKGGITKSSGLPASDFTQAYYKNDVLVSNIRPYFKKIWFANMNGGCSNDVLVFTANNECEPSFLYYVLSNDNFFNYATVTAKGTKMPRGDKKAIMEYEVPIYDIDTQQKIASILSALDEKIEVNQKINENLEHQAQAIFKNMFGDDIDNLDNTSTTLSDFIENVDNRGKTPPLSKTKTEYPIIDVKALSGNSRIIDYNNCTKYVDENTYKTWFRSGHPKNYDILISTVGSLAEIKLFLGNKGCIAQNVVGFRCKNISSLYLYQYLKYIKNDLVTYNIGSVQPSIKVTHIIKHKIFVPKMEKLQLFDEIAQKFTKQIYNNHNEIENLKNIRDALLPKLMNGEIDVLDVKL